MYNEVCFPPYMFSILKSHISKIPDINGKTNWLPPISDLDIDTQIVKQKLKHTDILALSCYEWNWTYQIDLGRLARSINKNCIILLGGPQPDWKDPLFFDKFPWANAVIKGDGEEPFEKILNQVLNKGSKNLDAIEGVWTKNNFDSPEAKTISKFKLNSEKSPYLEEEKLFFSFANNFNKSNAGHLWYQWETSRGCPYSCVFCDWGSATFSKLRTVDMGRLEKEADFFGRIKAHTVYITDSNFGILPRDLEITQILVKTNKKYGYPKNIFFNPPKNNPGRLVIILEELHRAGLLRYCVQNNLQSTQKNVLKVMKRLDVGEKAHIKFTKELHKKEIPVGAALIMGNPGETTEDFKNSIFDILNWGIHNEIRVFNWALLPNAPAAQKKFVNEWGIKTVQRHTIRNFIHKNFLNNKYAGFSEYLTSHKNMSEADWVENSIFSTFLITFHCLGISRLLSIYLKKTKHVSYRDFYETLYSDFLQAWDKESSTLRKLFVDFLQSNKSPLNLSIDPHWPYLVDPEGWLFIQLSSDIKRLKRLLSHTLEKMNLLNFETEDLLQWSLSLIIDHEYNSKYGRRVHAAHDWNEYFREALLQAGEVAMEAPRTEPFTLYIKEKGTGPYRDIPLDFKDTHGKTIISKYFFSVVGHRSGRHLRTYFHDFKKYGLEKEKLYARQRDLGLC